jgi:hypothetical protein
MSTPVTANDDAILFYFFGGGVLMMLLEVVDWYFDIPLSQHVKL